MNTQSNLTPAAQRLLAKKAEDEQRVKLGRIYAQPQHVETSFIDEPKRIDVEGAVYHGIINRIYQQRAELEHIGFPNAALVLEIKYNKPDGRGKPQSVFRHAYTFDQKKELEQLVKRGVNGLFLRDLDVYVANGQQEPKSAEILRAKGAKLVFNSSQVGIPGEYVKPIQNHTFSIGTYVIRGNGLSQYLCALVGPEEVAGTTAKLLENDSSKSRMKTLFIGQTKGQRVWRTLKPNIDPNYAFRELAQVLYEHNLLSPFRAKKLAQQKLLTISEPNSEGKTFENSNSQDSDEPPVRKSLTQILYEIVIPSKFSQTSSWLKQEHADIFEMYFAPSRNGHVLKQNYEPRVAIQAIAAALKKEGKLSPTKITRLTKKGYLVPSDDSQLSQLQQTADLEDLVEQPPYSNQQSLPPRYTEFQTSDKNKFSTELLTVGNRDISVFGTGLTQYLIPLVSGNYLKTKDWLFNHKPELVVKLFGENTTSGGKSRYQLLAQHKPLDAFKKLALILYEGNQLTPRKIKQLVSLEVLPQSAQDNLQTSQKTRPLNPRTRFQKSVPHKTTSTENTGELTSQKGTLKSTLTTTATHLPAELQNVQQPYISSNDLGLNVSQEDLIPTWQLSQPSLESNEFAGLPLSYMLEKHFNISLGHALVVLDYLIRGPQFHRSVPIDKKGILPQTIYEMKYQAGEYHITDIPRVHRYDVERSEAGDQAFLELLQQKNVTSEKLDSIISSQRKVIEARRRNFKELE
jgi:hypothetical protein